MYVWRAYMEIWIVNHMFVPIPVSAGFVMKEIETLCLNNPARVLREGGFIVPRAR